MMNNITSRNFVIGFPIRLPGHVLRSYTPSEMTPTEYDGDDRVTHDESCLAEKDCVWSWFGDARKWPDNGFSEGKIR
jgi:hypothetical protein